MFVGRRLGDAGTRIRLPDGGHQQSGSGADAMPRFSLGRLLQSATGRDVELPRPDWSRGHHVGLGLGGPGLEGSVSVSVWSRVQKFGARFTEYLTIYHKIIVSLSYDRRTLLTYNVLSSFPGISRVSLRTLSQTILRF